MIPSKTQEKESGAVYFHSDKFNARAKFQCKMVKCHHQIYKYQYSPNHCTTSSFNHHLNCHIDFFTSLSSLSHFENCPLKIFSKCKEVISKMQIQQPALNKKQLATTSLQWPTETGYIEGRGIIDEKWLDQDYT